MIRFVIVITDVQCFGMKNMIKYIIIIPIKSS